MENEILKMTGPQKTRKDAVVGFTLPTSQAQKILADNRPVCDIVAESLTDYFEKHPEDVGY